MKTVHILLTLHAPRRHGDFITYARHIADQFDGNPHVPTPVVPIATFKAHIDTLAAAHVAAEKNAPGAVDTRNVALQQVMTDVHQLAGQGQSIADGKPAEAAAIIHSLGFGTHVHGVHAKPDIEARMAPGGVVLLRAISAGKHGAYEWQFSADGGKTWTALPSTDHAHASVTGLTIGQSYEFRVRANVSGVVGDWHETVPFLVH